MTMGRLFRQTLTVARRDFIATVFTPTFLLFLLTPLLMAGFATVGGAGAASMAKSAEGKVRVVAIASAEDGRRLRAADESLRELFRQEDLPPPLFIEAPGPDTDRQAQALLDNDSYEATAVMHGPIDKPLILYAAPSMRHARYLEALADQAVQNRASSDRPVVHARFAPAKRATGSSSGRGQAAFFTVFGLFLLSLMLTSQVAASIAEERSNKVIEVLAAAVPLESVFLGKLIGMFGVALVFVGFWGVIFTQLGTVLPANFGSALGGMAPAVGPVFPFLFFAYFTMAYMLLGAVFLGVGAQASTPREIQMLSLPITVFQMGMLGLAVAASGDPGSWIALAAEVFPFSSPFAMGARAAGQPELWPHLLAIAWQLLWVAITVTIAARLFRRGVLKSGGPARRRKKAAP